MDDHTHLSPATHDVVVIGGGAAGLAAALQLGRSRRSVAVVDAGEPRNAPAAHMHSYLGHEGLPPTELLSIARREVEAYGVTIVSGSVSTVRSLPHGGFDVVLEGGATLGARRVLLATGLVDELPAIAGLATQWGRGVLHCPYCHGWEVQDQRIVVLATGPMSAHQAQLFRQLSDQVVVVVHDPEALSADDRARLAARGIELLDGPVAEVVSAGGDLSGVRLVDGRTIPSDAVVVAPRFVPRADPLAELGIVPVPAPMGTGEMVPTDDMGATSVPGVWAAGNVADVSHQVLQAAAHGSRIGAAINGDLVREEFDRAEGAASRDSAERWDRRYQEEIHWSGHPNGALVAEMADASPGSALDVGCGEGADAIWLSQRGWKVTGLDISQVALDRAAAAAADAGCHIDWVRADVASEPPAAGTYDLVMAHYASLPSTPGDEAIRALVAAVAPGGTLLVVSHDLPAGVPHGHEGWDPADYVQPHDFVERLGPDWSVEIDESRPRVLPPGSDPGRGVPDLVLRARRQA